MQLLKGCLALSLHSSVSFNLKKCNLFLITALKSFKLLYFILTLGIVLLWLKPVWCIWRRSAVVFFRRRESMHFHFECISSFVLHYLWFFWKQYQLSQLDEQVCLTYKWPIYLLLKQYPSVVIYVDYKIKRKQINWSCGYQYCLLWFWHVFFFLTSKMLEDLYDLSNLPSFALICIQYIQQRQLISRDLHIIIQWNCK